MLDRVLGRIAEGCLACGVYATALGFTGEAKIATFIVVFYLGMSRADIYNNRRK
jgi:hypothetical protein